MTPFQAIQTAPTRLRLPGACRQRLSELAVAGHPFEVCGLLLGRGQERMVEVDGIVPARNLDRERPRDRYLMDPRDFLAADQTARNSGLEIVGLWHSHPDSPACPSETDRVSAWAGYSYLIISTTATQATNMRSWRLDGDRFLEECLEESIPHEEDKP